MSDTGKTKPAFPGKASKRAAPPGAQDGASPDPLEETSGVVDVAETAVEAEVAVAREVPLKVSPHGYVTTGRYPLRNPQTGDVFRTRNSPYQVCKPKKLDGWLQAQIDAGVIKPFDPLEP